MEQLSNGKMERLPNGKMERLANGKMEQLPYGDKEQMPCGENGNIAQCDDGKNCIMAKWHNYLRVQRNNSFAQNGKIAKMAYSAKMGKRLMRKSPNGKWTNCSKKKKKGKIAQRKDCPMAK